MIDPSLTTHTAQFESSTTRFLVARGGFLEMKALRESSECEGKPKYQRGPRIKNVKASCRTHWLCEEEAFSLEKSRSLPCTEEGSPS